jgi:hypothetical protein
VIPSPINIILLVMMFGSCVVGIVAWLSIVSCYLSMRANRTERATTLVRLRPWWFLLNDTLTQTRMEWRSRLLRSAGVFLLSAIVIGAVLGGSLLYCNGNSACLVVHFR